MASDIVRLIASDRRYEGFKSIRVTQSIESIAGSFALDVSDRWDGEIEPWPIAEGDKCRVLIGDDVVITGYIDKRSVSFDANTRSLSYSGRDKAGDLVDCSALVSEGTVSKKKWTFHNVDVVQLATEIAKPHGISVSVQAGLGAVLTKDKKVELHPGDTCFEVISKAAAAAGVLVVSDGKGGIVVTRGGKERAASLVEGVNMKSGGAEYDSSDRHSHYLVSTQVPGSDEADAAATLIQAEAFDLGMSRRPNRVLLIRPDKGYTVADSRRRADWEARIRAARAEKQTVTVVGWRQPGGALWKVNTLTRVRSPKGLGVDGDMLISQVEFTISDAGQTTQLSLVRPDAFTPEPSATVAPSEATWKENAEIAKGG